MKRMCRTAIWFLIWIGAAALLAGCQRTEGDGEKKSIRIGVSLYRGDDTFINNIRGELENTTGISAAMALSIIAEAAVLSTGLMHITSHPREIKRST